MILNLCPHCGKEINGQPETAGVEQTGIPDHAGSGSGGNLIAHYQPGDYATAALFVALEAE